jgi:hypothetical protein
MIVTRRDYEQLAGGKERRIKDMDRLGIRIIL